MDAAKIVRYCLVGLVVLAVTLLSALKVEVSEAVFGLFGAVIYSLIAGNGGGKVATGAGVGAGLGAAVLIPALLGGCTGPDVVLGLSSLAGVFLVAAVLLYIGHRRDVAAQDAREAVRKERARRALSEHIRRHRAAHGVIGALCALALGASLLTLPAGCAGWQQTTKTALDAAGAASKGLTALAGPALHKRCGDAANVCLASGCASRATTNSEAISQCKREPQCGLLWQCMDEREAIIKALDAVDQAIAAGYTFLAIGDEKEASARLAKVLQLLGELQQLLRRIGVI